MEYPHLCPTKWTQGDVALLLHELYVQYQAMLCNFDLVMIE